MKTMLTSAMLGLMLACAPGLAMAQEGGEGGGDEGGAADEGASEGLELVSLELATRMEEGRAVDPGDTFSRGAGRLFAVVRVANPSRAETHVRVAFEKAEGPEAAGIELSIGASRRWKTVARTSTGREPGRYRCVVRDAEGNVLGQQEFTITE